MALDRTEQMREAPLVVDHYLILAVTRIDDLMGPGYAKKNPELVGAFIAACSNDARDSAHRDMMETPISAITSFQDMMEEHHRTKN